MCKDEPFRDSVNYSALRRAIDDFLKKNNWEDSHPAYECFGIVYGQTISDEKDSSILHVLVEDKKKWLWTKMKYSL